MKTIICITLFFQLFVSISVSANTCTPIVNNGKVLVEVINGDGKTVYSEQHQVRNEKKYSGLISSSKIYKLLKYDKSGKIKVDKSKLNIAAGGTTIKATKKDHSAIAKIGGCSISEVTLFTRLGKQKEPFVHNGVLKLVSTTKNTIVNRPENNKKTRLNDKSVTSKTQLSTKKSKKEIKPLMNLSDSNKDYYFSVENCKKGNQINVHLSTRLDITNKKIVKNILYKAEKFAAKNCPNKDVSQGVIFKFKFIELPRYKRVGYAKTRNGESWEKAIDGKKGKGAYKIHVSDMNKVRAYQDKLANKEKRAKEKEKIENTLYGFKLAKKDVNHKLVLYEIAIDKETNSRITINGKHPGKNKNKANINYICPLAKNNLYNWDLQIYVETPKSTNLSSHKLAKNILEKAKYQGLKFCQNYNKGYRVEVVIYKNNEHKEFIENLVTGKWKGSKDSKIKPDDQKGKPKDIEFTYRNIPANINEFKGKKLTDGKYLFDLGYDAKNKVKFITMSSKPEDRCSQMYIVVENLDLLLNDSAIKEAGINAGNTYSKVCKPTHILKLEIPFIKSTNYEKLAQIYMGYHQQNKAWREPYIQSNQYAYKINYEKKKKQKKELALKRIEKQKAFKRKGNVSTWVNIEQLEKNPFIYEGKTIGVALKFHKMIKRNIAIMKGLRKFAGSIDYNVPVIVTNVPNTPSTSKYGSLVAAKVIEAKQSDKSFTDKPYYLKFITATKCSMRNCKDYLGK